MTNEKENDNLDETCEVRALIPLGSGKHVLMPGINTENNRRTPEITLEDQLSAGDEESVGFNPYDTAVLYER